MHTLWTVLRIVVAASICLPLLAWLCLNGYALVVRLWTGKFPR